MTSDHGPNEMLNCQGSCTTSGMDGQPRVIPIWSRTRPDDSNYRVTTVVCCGGPGSSFHRQGGKLSFKSSTKGTRGSLE